MTPNQLIAGAAVTLAGVGTFAQIAGGVSDAVEASPMSVVDSLVNAGAAGLMLLAVFMFLKRDRERDELSSRREQERDDAAATREREWDDAQAALFGSYEKQVEGFKAFVNDHNRELIGLTREMITVVGEVKNAVTALERVVYSRFPKIDGQVTDAAMFMKIQPRGSSDQPPHPAGLPDPERAGDGEG